MPIGEIEVGYTHDYNKKFTVKSASNLIITNYRNGEPKNAGEFKVTLFNGNTKIQRCFENKKSDETDLKNLELNTKRYNIFDRIRKLDNNESDITFDDLKKAKNLTGKYGIKKVLLDAKAGIGTIVCDDNVVLKFDFETKEEAKIRKQKEAKTKAKAEAERKTKESKKNTIHLNFWEKLTRFALRCFYRK